MVSYPELLRGLPVPEYREVLFPQRPWAWTVSGGSLLLLCVVSPKPQRNYVNICAELSVEGELTVALALGRGTGTAGGLSGGARWMGWGGFLCSEI